MQTDLTPLSHPWLTDPDNVAVINALGESRARFVGGCVRNALWNYDVADIDIATQLEPGAVIDALKAAGIKSVPTGVDHGTVTAVVEGRPIEITSLRKDVATDGRRAVVAFTQDWAQDAQRRDFTVNALYADLNGTIYDPTGQGLADAKARKEAVLPEASNVEGLTKFVALERREALRPVDPLLRIMAMGARNPLPMALLTKRMKMSKAETARLRDWADDGTSFDPGADERAKLAAIYKTGKRLAMDRCLMRATGESDPVLSSKWMSLVDLALGWTPPVFPLGGKDLAAAGVAPGPAMGKKLDALKALWVRSGSTADKQKLLMALKLLG